ncbi:hypothetical protein DPX16_23658 [Anabarilius grahami]|uniref:Uncharacterized protein n=1 Tax=Anabarilius grahami TaxID=495550 RepID=A0A3N0XPP5_ANAGA|nr:hypothetical protein DPX16_23658 [Anabarilius grahami]
MVGADKSTSKSISQSSASVPSSTGVTSSHTWSDPRWGSTSGVMKFALGLAALWIRTQSSPDDSLPAVHSIGVWEVDGMIVVGPDPEKGG